jgi:glycosyltransferase involved in cell wall biosynthesis
MDNFLEINTLSKNLHSRKIQEVEHSIEKLIRDSRLCMGICEGMCYQYGKRFNREFYPFQHAVDMNFWNRNYIVRKDPQPFMVLYAGRISMGTIHSLFLIANSLDNCNDKFGSNFEFQIQTTSPVPDLLKKFSKYRCVKIHEAVAYNKLPGRYAEADLLVLPMDFDEDSIMYIKYSMPTKVPEYLISGVPIFVLAHEITALYKYATSIGWAFVNSTENEADIENLLINIWRDYNKRVEVSRIAKSIGQKNHDINDVRSLFKSMISESCCKVY